MAKTPPYTKTTHATDHAAMDAINTRYPRLIAADATPTRAWIKQDPAFTTLASVNLTPADVPPSSVIRISALMQFHPTSIAGKNFRIQIGGVTVIQVPGLVANTQTLGIEVYLYVRSSAVTIIRAQGNAGAGSGNTLDGTGNFFGANTSGGPTTMSVDMTVNNTLTIQTQVQGAASSNGEWHELHGFTVECLQISASPTGYSPASAVAYWGDSLTAGTGATLYTSDYPAVVTKATYGRPGYNGGVGGEKSGQILTRILQDKVRGRHWTCVLWMGRNNVGDAGMQATVLADIASAVANLSHSRFLVLTVLNAKTETTGTANYNAIIALNNAILAGYPNNSYDIRSFLATDPDGTIPSGLMSDSIHLNATGYASVAAQVSAFLAGKGW